MDETIELIDELINKIPKGDARLLQVQLAKSLLVATEDIAELTKRKDIQGLENAIKKLYNEQIEIKSNFTITQFPKGGLNRNIK